MPFEVQEMPNEMGNAVFLPLFSFIRSFILVRFCFVFVRVPCETFVVRLFLTTPVLFRLQRCDQDSYITGQSDTMHVHTSSHMWMFKTSHLFFVFSMFVHFLLRLDTTYRMKTKNVVVLCETDVYRQPKSKQEQLKHTEP